MLFNTKGVKTRQTSTSVTIPAPIGGLNGRDPLAQMAATDAYLMDNMFPGTATAKSRKGCIKFSSAALAGPVQTLAVWAGAAGDKLLACAGIKIYNVSTGVATELKTGLSNATPVTAMFSNAGVQSLHFANGQDTPHYFNGTVFANHAITGTTGSVSTLNFVFSFKERLYWGQKDMLGFYYLPVGAINGALSYFDLQQVSELGGYLVAIASYSAGEQGDTPEDRMVFITSKGECIVYEGFDPSNPASWGLVGRYYAAPPIGNRCAFKYGTELVILTRDGAIPFSEIRRTGDAKARGNADAPYSAITSKLGRFLSLLNANAGVAGWMGQQYISDEDGWLIINAPATASLSGAYYQFVMNTKTNAWCRYTNWNCMSMAVFGNRLYFGRYDGYVMLADEGRNDDTAKITFDVKTAYNYFEDGNGLGLLQKHFQWASMLISCDGTPPLDGKFNVDYKEDPPEYINVLANQFGAEWDVATWDTAEWGDDGRTQRFIITLNKGGFAGALWIRASLSGLKFEWYATQYVMEKTRGLLI